MTKTQSLDQAFRQGSCPAARFGKMRGSAGRIAARAIALVRSAPCVLWWSQPRRRTTPPRLLRRATARWSSGSQAWFE
jgi:hypothetical protein